MSDERAHDWLDDAAAERLLRGARDGGAPAGDPRAEALARLLAAAATPAPLDSRHEDAAVAAFRAARDATPAQPASRRDRVRDDWRRRGGTLRAGRSVRALAGALVATAALGAVAAAAAGALPVPFGSLGGAADAGHASPTASATSPAVHSPSTGPDQEHPAGGSTGGVPAPSAAARSGGAAARDVALCHAWADTGRRGKRTDAKAFERLVSEAGGRHKVRGYCAGLVGTSDGKGGGQGRNGKQGRNAGSGDDAKDGKDGKGDGASDGKGGGYGRTPGHRHHHPFDHGSGQGHAHEQGVESAGTDQAPVGN
jgi:hypothetical protein